MFPLAHASWLSYFSVAPASPFTVSSQNTDRTLWIGTWKSIRSIWLACNCIKRGWFFTILVEQLIMWQWAQMVNCLLLAFPLFNFSDALCVHGNDRLTWDVKWLMEKKTNNSGNCVSPVTNIRHPKKMMMNDLDPGLEPWSWYSAFHHIFIVVIQWKLRWEDGIAVYDLPPWLAIPPWIWEHAALTFHPGTHRQI